MKIVHLLYDDIDNPWLGGGGARRAHEVNRRLPHEVTVITGGYPDAPALHERDGVTYCHTPAAASYAQSRLNYMRHAPAIVRRLRPDLLVEDFSAYNPLFSPIWAGRPVVGLVQNVFGRHSRAKFGLKGAVAGLVERPALRQFRHIIVLSRSSGLELHRAVGLRGKHAAVIPSGIASAFYQPPHPTSPARGEEQSSLQSSILFVGRLDIYQKGLDTLLAAFYRVRQQQPDIKLTIVGGGAAEQEGRLRDLIAGYDLSGAIDWRGRLPQAAVARIMRDPSTTMLVMPSRYESWGMTAAEAGAAGLPVLGFDIAGLDEAVATHGLLLPASEDEEERVTRLTEGTLQLWRDPQRRAALAVAGQGWAQKFRWERIVAAQERFYFETLGARP